jgi:hypothetical protein
MLLEQEGLETRAENLLMGGPCHKALTVTPNRRRLKALSHRALTPGEPPGCCPGKNPKPRPPSPPPQLPQPPDPNGSPHRMRQHIPTREHPRACGTPAHPPSMPRQKPMRTTPPEHLAAQTPHLTHEHGAVRSELRVNRPDPGVRDTGVGSVTARMQPAPVTTTARMRAA